MLETAYLIPLLPLISFGLLTFGGRKLPGKGSFVAIGTIGWGLFHSVWVFLTVLMTPNWQPIDVHLYDFFKLSENASPIIEIAFRIDGVTAVMLVVVTLVSFLVHVYSLGYMGYNTPEEDVRYTRFYGALSLFSFSMLMLVLSNNLAVVFISWELVGLCSYFLIGHWFEKDYPDPKQITPREAGMKAFLTTKMGDLGFVIGLLWLYGLCLQTNPNASFNMQSVYYDIRTGLQSGAISEGALTAVGILLFCGAIGKSAQWPLHTWLPDAMEGPTPVSALIHAATMVAAGVYLVGRIFPILTPGAGCFIAHIGGFTALFAATIAVAQFDIKKVLAYSTISQLGYMILSLGVAALDRTGETHGYEAGMMHLATHAMFKACLFLCSGSVIHAMHHALHHVHSDADPQDMRNMGGLFSTDSSMSLGQILFLPFYLPFKCCFGGARKLWESARMPITFWCMLVATVAISGIPFFTGFLSKDAILGGTLVLLEQRPGMILLPVFGFGAALLTAFYMFRLIYLTFFGEAKMPQGAFEHVHESPRTMAIPITILACLSFWVFFSFDPSGLWSHGWFFQKAPAPERSTTVLEKVHLVSLASSIERGRTQAGSSFSLLPLASAEEHGEEARGGLPGSELRAAPGDAGGESHGEAHGEAHHGGVHGIHVLALCLSLIIAFGGVIWARSWYGSKRGVPAAEIVRKHPVIHRALVNKWYFDELYDWGVIKPALKIARICGEFDSGVVDWFVNIMGTLTVFISRVKGAIDTYIVDALVDAVGFVTAAIGQVLRRLQTGLVQSYLVYITLLAAVALLILQATS